MENKKSVAKKDRGAEQGDVHGPVECSLASGMVAAEARLRIAEQQVAGPLPLIGTHEPGDAERLPDEQRSRMQRIHNLQHKGWEKLIGADDPQTSGTLMDGNILYPELELP